MDEFRDLKGLVRWCTEPDKIELMIELIEDDQGYPLYKAISEAKARLSSEEKSNCAFPPLGEDFRGPHQARAISSDGSPTTCAAWKGRSIAS